MLKPAGMYEDQLKKLFAEIAFDEEYMFMTTSSWRDTWTPSADTWSKHEFVSVNEENEVVGYLSYNVDRDALTTNRLQVINFRKDGLNRVFGNDLRRMFTDIFLKFQFRKLNFMVVIGNPAEAFYDKYVEKMNGRIVGYYESDAKLIDGNYYDVKIYEVTRDNFISAQQPATGK